MRMQMHTQIATANGHNKEYGYVSGMKRAPAQCCVSVC